MKKIIESKVAELKRLYPGKRIIVVNGFLGVDDNGMLKHTTYLGKEYIEIDGIIYFDNHDTGISKKLLAINKVWG